MWFSNEMSLKMCSNQHIKLKNWKLWMLCIYMLLDNVTGKWQDPSAKNVDDFSDGIEIKPDQDAIEIRINENIGNDRQNFAIAELLVEPGCAITKISGDVTFTVETPETNRWFLNLRSSFDYENGNNDFTVVLESSGSLKIVSIKVVNVNDNPPRLVKEIDQIEPQSELKDIPDSIVTLYAEDPDGGSVSFEIINFEDEGKPFEIETTGNNGTVYLKFPQQLNYSDRTSHRLNVMLKDSPIQQGDTVLNQTVTFTILVKDEPNLPPEFTRPPTIRSITENHKLGEEIFVVAARDGDFGLNWPIKYSIKDDVLELFKIDENNGSVSLRNDVDAEDQNLIDRDLTYEFSILAYEDYDKNVFPELGPDETETKQDVTISITDLNDNPPKLCVADPDEKCSPTESFEFEIDEHFIGQIPMKYEKTLFVKDIDTTNKFSGFKAELSFSSETSDIIKNAFEIRPAKGAGTETFFLSVKNINSTEFDDDAGTWIDPIMFQVKITDTDKEEFEAVASITATIKDINDNRPEFKTTQYNFKICENTGKGTLLKSIIPSESFPTACKDSTEGADILVKADDGDKHNTDFGPSSVRYRWSQSRVPPIDIDSQTGEMTVNSDNAFDYERFKEEVYIVEAFDNNGEDVSLVSSVPVVFTILDVNDVPVDLVIPKGGRATIKENTTKEELKESIFDGIIARDVDVTANVTITFEVNSAFSSGNPIIWAEERVKNWFILESDCSMLHTCVATLNVNNDDLPDREGYGNGDIDRVDLTIFATDWNTEEGNSISGSQVTILIEDINDHPPVWADGEDYTTHEEPVEETEEWGAEGDNSTDYQREIFSMRFNDPDRDTTFDFTLANPKCRASRVPEVCDEILGLISVTIPNPRIGKAVIRRTLGKKIDREERRLFENDDTDALDYVITIFDSDQKNSLTSELTINVEDRNDNTPEFVEPYNETYYVKENVPTNVEIVHVQATDKDKPDKFGKVSYLLVDEVTDGSNNGIDFFEIDRESGSLTAISGTYNWSAIPEFKVKVKAVDNYREFASSNSLFVITTITIKVNDTNTYAPEFLTKNGSTNPIAEVYEDEVENGLPFGQRIQIRDLDDPTRPNGQFTAKIASISKSPKLSTDPIDLFTLFQLGDKIVVPPAPDNRFDVPILPLKQFHGLWGTYTLTLNATDGEGSDPKQLSATSEYVIRIKNANLNAPVFVYPNNTEIYLHIMDSSLENLFDLKTNQTVPNINATDADIDDDTSQNGHVKYEIVPGPEGSCNDLDGKTLFQVNEETGKLRLINPLGESDDNTRCNLTVLAKDMAEPSRAKNVSAVIRFYFVSASNAPPQFAVPTFSCAVPENQTNDERNEAILLPKATDIPFLTCPTCDNKIYYHIKGGNKTAFKITQEESDEEDEHGEKIRIPKLFTNDDVELDYETIKDYSITIFTSNFENDQTEDVEPEDVDDKNRQYLVVTINLIDKMDTAPQFVRKGVITGGFAEFRSQDDVITEITATDPDVDDYVTFHISSEFEASDSSLNPLLRDAFKLRPHPTKSNSAQVVLNFKPEGTYQGYFSFQITAKDSVNMTATALCRMFVITREYRIDFGFFNSEEDIVQGQEVLAQALGDFFETTCNVDRIFTSTQQRISTRQQQGSRTEVVAETHFVSLDAKELVLESFINAQQYDSEVWNNLQQRLSEKGFILSRIGENTNVENDSNSAMVYILIAGVAVLAVTLVIISASCFYNNRSLSRRVRALTATTFGSQQSDLNRIGAMDAPNTNNFAIEGSNPIWSVTAAEPKNIPDFDAESIGSGGSVLIGAEDEDYFQKSSKNPVFQADDIVADYALDDDIDDGGYENEQRYENNSESEGITVINSPFSAKTSRNPLMNLGLNNTDADADIYDDEPEYYEDIDIENNDAGLF